MPFRVIFLAAYACSGLAALIYQVTWTRLLTLHMGHTTAAVSTVVAAFMCGLAGGAILGGRLAPRFTLQRSFYSYMFLEALVAGVALLLPSILAALIPVLSWSYRDGAPNLLFPTIRLLFCLVIIVIPACALGATFPIAARCYVRGSDRLGRAAATLYVTNTAGAALGALAAGFLLIPRIGVFGTTLVGVGANAMAIAGAWMVARSPIGAAPDDTSPADADARGSARRKGRKTFKSRVPESPLLPGQLRLAAIVLGLSGLAGLLYEIAWTRVLSLIIGPTTYAVAATLAGIISGIAVGSLLGSQIAKRSHQPALWLAVALSGTAIAVSGSSWIAGGPLLRLVAQQLAASSVGFDQLLVQHVIAATTLALTTAIGLGAAFPLSLELVSRNEPLNVRQLGVIYGVNTLGAVAGSLMAGFVFIPWIGLQLTLLAAGGILVIDACIVAGSARLIGRTRLVALLPAAIAVVILIISPPWDRNLLSSGAYKYARDAANDYRRASGTAQLSRAGQDGFDLEAALGAGQLLYYRDGAASTVSVKRRTGALSLAIDGKVDASNSGDMLTQRALAHLPLLLHPNPRDVAIIGLGSGVTLGSALTHPIASADVIEISPEVVEASRLFSADNSSALEDPRSRLIVGDGRTHLLLSSRKYDVLISEPSNPWITGVAALFTREFFLTARNRLAPGGIICQWAHTYDISEGDLRSIVATFASVFPNGTMWLVGQGDLLLVASAEPLTSQLGNIERGWRDPRIAADLRAVSANEPFELWSLFAGGPQELMRYAADVGLQTDDRMALEFSGPRALNDAGAAAANARQLRGLLEGATLPPTIQQAFERARAPEWRNRGEMMRRLGDYPTAYQDFARALAFDPTNAVGLDGLVQAAAGSGQQADALRLLKSAAQRAGSVPAIWIAMSRLLAASGSFEDAVAAARTAVGMEPVTAAALEQLASLFSDAGDAEQLARVVEELRRVDPQRATGYYFAAASEFMRRRPKEALSLVQEAIVQDPRYVQAHNLLGAIHATLGQPSEARNAFQTALSLNPRDSSIYVNLGLLELSSGNAGAAAGYFAEALSLDPDSEAARRGLTTARQGGTE
jgi:spermidine synthase